MVFTYLVLIIMYCVQGACASAVFDGVHILGFIIMSVYRVLVLVLYSTVFTYLVFIIMYCVQAVQGAGAGAILYGVHVLGLIIMYCV